VKEILAAWGSVWSSGGTKLLVNLLDIALVSYLIYRLLLLVRGTRAVSLIKGLLVLIVLLWVTQPLPALHWLVRQVTLPGVIALVIIFQPELRMTLERIGRGGLIGHRVAAESEAQIINRVTAAAEALATQRYGALIVLERDTGLEDIARTGRRIDAEVSRELLCSLFFPRSPLHDGAVIIRGSRVLAAACTLPHSDQSSLPASMGMRHRAALGITERTDAVVVVVSEETGQIALAVEGELQRNLKRVTLSERLLDLMEARAERRSTFPWLRWQ